MLAEQRQRVAVQFMLAAQFFENRLAQRRQIIETFTQRRHWIGSTLRR